MDEPATILLLLKRVDCNDGVASYLESVATGLRDAGDRVVIVSGDVTTLYGSEARRRTIAASVADWIVLDGFRPSRPTAAHVRRVLSVINEQRVDVISPQGFAVLPIGYIAGRLSRRPLVTNFHLLPTIRERWRSIQHLMYRLVTNVFASDRYLAMSTEIEHFFRDVCRIPQSRIRKQMLGVDTDFYRPPTDTERQQSRLRFAIDPGTLVAILPARLNVTKGHDIAAAAFRSLRVRRPDATMLCVFAGAGDQRDSIEADVMRDDADRTTFRFLGFVDRETLRDAYWAADIVLLPSLVEGFGLVVAEAMCCGAIVIRTPSGGWQDQVIEAKTGYVVPFKDPVALATAIEKVMDAPDRAAMRDEAMHLASTSFARTRMIEATSRLYREVASTRTTRR